MLVDELLIPHPAGAVHVRFDERVTVLAGLDAPSRARFAHLLVSGLVGAGPATVLVRDDLGRPGRIEPGTTVDTTPPRADALTEVGRLCVVGAAELGVRHQLPSPAVAAERTAVAIAHRQLVRELAAIEAGAAERARLLREIGEGSDGTSEPADGASEDAAPAVRALERARVETDQARAAAQAEIHACDRELEALARSADVPVGVEGPGAALTAALVQQRHRPVALADADPPTRLLARRRASLRARMAELPDDAEVAATRRRLEAVAGRLARLEDGTGADVERTRTALLGRLALLRPDGVTAIAPLVLDEALVGLAPDDLCDLLDLVARVGERTQIVMLTGEPAVATWARHRAAGGQLRLIELARASTPDATAMR